MRPMIIKYGVAYKEIINPKEEPKEQYECDFDTSADVIQRAIHLLDNGKLSVVMFSYIEGFDASRITWGFVLENEFVPTSRKGILSCLQEMKDHNKSWQPGGKYPQSGFNTAQDEKDWLSEIINGTMELVQNSNDIDYLFIEKYFGKHPQAQGHACKADNE